MDTQTLIDRAEITDLLTRYATAVDNRDWELYRSVFTPDAHIDYTSAGGIKGSVDELARWLGDALALFEVTQHLIANVEIEVEGDQATARAMFFNPMKVPRQPLWTIGGWYSHKLVRTGEGWKSRELIETSSWTDGIPEPQPES